MSEAIEVTHNRPGLAELGALFDEEIAADLRQWPQLSVLVSGATFYRYGLARMVRVTLRVARRMPKGIPIRDLREVYAALDVPAETAEFIERKLAEDGVGGVKDGRLVFAASPSAWAKLSATRAE